MGAAASAPADAPPPPPAGHRRTARCGDPVKPGPPPDFSFDTPVDRPATTAAPLRPCSPAVAPDDDDGGCAGCAAAADVPSTTKAEGGARGAVAGLPSVASPAPAPPPARLAPATHPLAVPTPGPRPPRRPALDEGETGTAPSSPAMTFCVGPPASVAGTPSLTPAVVPPPPLPRRLHPPPPPPPAAAAASPRSPTSSFAPLAWARVAIDGGSGAATPIGGGSGAGTPFGGGGGSGTATPRGGLDDDDDSWDAVSRSSEDVEEVAGPDEAAAAATAAALAAAADLRPAAPLRVRTAAVEAPAAPPPTQPGLSPRAAAAAAAVGPLLARLRAIQGDDPETGGARTPPPPPSATTARTAAGGSAHGGAAAWAALDPGRKAASLSPRASASAAAVLRRAAVSALAQQHKGGAGGGRPAAAARPASLPPRSPPGAVAGGASRPASPFDWRAASPPPAAAQPPPPPPPRLVLTPTGPPPGSSLFGVASPRPPPAGPPREAARLTLTRAGGCTWLNGYLVLRFLGRGAYGRVYLVMDGADQALYAAKVVRVGPRASPSSASASSPARPHDDPSADAARRAADFRREVALMTRASRHPGVVALREVVHDPDRGRALLVMDYCEGGPVQSRHGLEAGRGERLPEAVAAAHFRGVAAALAYLHGRRILHGDIKPENVLLTARGGALLSDFGCSKLMRAAKTAPAPGPAPLSPLFADAAAAAAAHGASGAGPPNNPLHCPLADADDLVERCVGTPAFLAPEQVRPGAKYRGRPADVWALGVTLYAWVTGRLPFNAQRPAGAGDAPTAVAASLFAAIQAEPLRFPSNVSLSPALRDLLSRMLTKDPALRAGLAEVLAHPWAQQAGGGGGGGGGGGEGAPSTTTTTTTAAAAAPSTLDALAGRLAAQLGARRVDFADGQVMLRAGEAGASALLVLSGTAEVVVRFPAPPAPAPIPPDGLPPAVLSGIRRARRLARALQRDGGSSYAVALRSAGQLVVVEVDGEAATPPPTRAASVVARGKVSALILPAQALASAIAADPAARQAAREAGWARAAELLVLDAVVRLAGLSVAGVSDGVEVGGSAVGAVRPAAAAAPVRVGGRG